MFTTSKTMGLDAQLLLRNSARRMLFGAAEFGGWNLLVPTTAAVMARTHYAGVISGYITRKIEFEADQNKEHLSDEAIGLQIHDAVAKASVGFSQWLDDEPQRNDRLFEIVERTRSAQGLAMELFRARVIDDPKDTRWGIGEDPFVLAEALEAGAHWIASANFKTLRPDNMERWLDRVQAEGRCTHVPRPFIISPNTAIEKMIRYEGPGSRRYDDPTITRAIAQAVSEPSNPKTTLTHRIGILSRFGSYLTDSAMGEAGDNIRRWTNSASNSVLEGKEAVVWEQIEQMNHIVNTADVRRTREAEDRRMALEQSPRPTHQRQRRPTQTRTTT